MPLVQRKAHRRSWQEFNLYAAFDVYARSLKEGKLQAAYARTGYAPTSMVYSITPQLNTACHTLAISCRLSS